MKLSWETVAALAVAVAGGVVAVIFVPPDTWEALARMPWESIVGVVLAVLGTLGIAQGRPLVQRKPPTDGGPAALLLAVAMVGALASGCGTWADTARHTLESAARITDLSDRGLAAAIRSECGQYQGDAEAVDACLMEHGFDSARGGIHIADASLRTGQATIDAVEHVEGGEADWVAAAPCIANAVVSAASGVAAAIGAVDGVETLLVPLRALASTCEPEGDR